MGDNNHNIYYSKNNPYANSLFYKSNTGGLLGFLASRSAVLQNKTKANPPQVSTVTLQTPVHGENIWGFLSPLFHAIDQLTLNTSERLY